MRLFGDVGMIRGAAVWTRPWRIRVTPASVPAQGEPLRVREPAAKPEFDEAGRLYVFRFGRVQPQAYSIERDRIFEYLKRRRLPTEAQRQIRRDLRNRADFFGDVREIQTPPEIETLE